MSKRLTCYSFHSVKGGVGKSTLATFLARALAREQTTRLVDMDLTGTSLGDVLPLCAPCLDADTGVVEQPLRFHDRHTTRQLIEMREDAPVSQTPSVRFLNDFLLEHPSSWAAEDDIHPRDLSWRVQGSSERLRVLPSSALPRDLEQIMPVIFDEDHAAFLEARLECLLDSMLMHLEDERDLAVVFDTPPSIPGLSRAVLSLALRLGGEDKVPLAEDDDWIPEHLAEADVRWIAYIVVTPDLQDVRAANRWLQLVRADEESRFRIIVNRTDGEPEDVLRTLRDRLAGPAPAISSLAGSLATRAGGMASALDGLAPRLLDFEPIITVRRGPHLAFFDREDMPADAGMHALADLARTLMNRDLT